MAFKVRINPQAERDITEAAEFIAQDSPRQAQRWLADLRGRLRMIANVPLSLPIAPESEWLGVELRRFTHHSHRVFVRVREEERTLEVLRVYH